MHDCLRGVFNAKIANKVQAGNASPPPPPQQGPAPCANPAGFVVSYDKGSSSSAGGDGPVSSSSSFAPSSSSSSSSGGGGANSNGHNAGSASESVVAGVVPNVVTLAGFAAEFVGGGEVKAGIMAPVATAAKSLSLKASQPSNGVHAAKHAQTLQCDSVEAVFKFEDVDKVVLAGSVDVSISGLGDFNKRSKLRLDFRGLDQQHDGFVPLGPPQFVDRHSSHLLATFTSPCGLILKCYIVSRACFTTTHRKFRPAIPLGQRNFDVFRGAFQAAVVSLQDAIFSGDGAHGLTTAFAQRLDAYPTHSCEPVPGARVHMGVGDFNAVMGEAVRVLVASVEGRAWLAHHCVYFDGIGWKDQLCADITNFPPRNDLLESESLGTPGWARAEVGRRLLAFLNLDILSRGHRHDGDEAPAHPDPISIRIDMRVQHSMHTGEGRAAIGMLLDTEKMEGLLGALRYKRSKMRVYTVMLPHAESSNIQLNTQGTEDPHDMHPLSPPMVSAYSGFKNSFMTFGRNAMLTAEPIMPWVHYLVGTESTAPSSNLPDISKFKVALQQSIAAAIRVEEFISSMATQSTRASLQHNIEVGGANFTDTANFLIENFTYGDIDSLLSTSAKGVYLLVDTAEYWRVAGAVVYAWAVHLIAVLKRVATGVKGASDYANITAEHAQGEGHLCADSLATATVAEAFIHNLVFDGYSGTMFREALQHGFSHGGLMEFPGSSVVRPEGCSTAYLAGLQGLVAKFLETAKFQHFTSRSHSAKLTATIQKTRMWCGQLMRTLAQADGPGAQAPTSAQMLPRLASVVFCAYVAWVRAQLKMKGVKQITEKDPTNFTAEALRVFAEEAIHAHQSGTKIGVCDNNTKPALLALKGLFVDQPKSKSRAHAFYLAIFQMAVKAIKDRGWAPTNTKDTKAEGMLLKALAHHILDGGHCVHGSSTRQSTMWQDTTRGNVILFYQLKELEPFSSPLATAPTPGQPRRARAKAATAARQSKPVVFTKADVASYKDMANDLKSVRVGVLGEKAGRVLVSKEEYARVWHAMVVEHAKPGGPGEQVLGWKELTYSDPKYGFTLAPDGEIVAAHRPFDSVADLGKKLKKWARDGTGKDFDEINALARASPCSVLLTSPEAQGANHAMFSPKPAPVPPAPIGQWAPQPAPRPNASAQPGRMAAPPPAVVRPQPYQQRNSPGINHRQVSQRLAPELGQGEVYDQQQSNMSASSGLVLPAGSPTTARAAAAKRAAGAGPGAARPAKVAKHSHRAASASAGHKGRWATHTPQHSVVGATLHCNGNGSVAAPEWSGQNSLTCPLCKKKFRVKPGWY